MAYVPHYRLSMIGRLGFSAGPEMFSMNLCLKKRSPGLIGALLDPNNTVWDDLATDCGTWFSAAGSFIHNSAHLTQIKVAPIGADGKYTGPAVERAVGVNGPAGGTRPANQLAYAVTLRTEADLGRVKGRFYVPLPTMAIGTDGRWTDVDVDLVEDHAESLIRNINNQPGIDVLDLVVGVASQGRRNSDGSVKLAAGNHDVTSIAVGRVPDTQRRRRNKLSEAYSYRADLGLD